MDDIGSYAIWLMIGLSISSVAIGTIGALPYFASNGLSPGLKGYSYNGTFSPILSFLDGLFGMNGNNSCQAQSSNYASSTTPQISQNVMPQTNCVSQGLFIKLGGMFYQWKQLADFFAQSIPVVGNIVYIFSTFFEIVQMVGLFVLLTRIATIAKLIIPFFG